MLTYLLYGLFIVACFVLVISVLLQPGKADAGALFTSSVSSAAFGPRGTQTILAKITIFAAITFMITALMISFGVGGPRSVMEGGSVVTATPTPVASVTPQADASPAASPQTAASPAASDAASPAPAASPQAQASPATK